MEKIEDDKKTAVVRYVPLGGFRLAENAHLLTDLVNRYRWCYLSVELYVFKGPNQQGCRRQNTYLTTASVPLVLCVY